MSTAIVEILPSVNATLNATCAVLLVNGRSRIKSGQRLLHARFMVSALIVSTLFLVSYLTRMAMTGPTRFIGAPWMRATYLAILASHTLLAAIVVPLVLITVYLAARKRFAVHRRVARWTYPIWLYVSVTGVIVYVMLYHLASRRAH